MKCMLKMSSFGTINIMLGSCNLHKFPLKTTSKKTSMHQNKNKYSMTFFLLAFTHSYKFFNDRIKNIYWFYPLAFETRSHCMALAGLELFSRARSKSIHHHT